MKTEDMEILLEAAEDLITRMGTTGCACEDSITFRKVERWVTSYQAKKDNPVVGETFTLLEKANEKLKVATHTLDGLSRLGNGDSLGNSDGNIMAQNGLKRIKELEKQKAYWCSSCQDSVELSKAYERINELEAKLSTIIDIDQGRRSADVMKEPLDAVLKGKESLEESLKRG